MFHKRLATAFLILSFSRLAMGEGIPPSEWTPDEQKMVQQLRSMYQKQKLPPLTDEQAAVAVKDQRDRVARIMGRMAGMKSGNLPLLLGNTPGLVDSGQPSPPAPQPGEPLSEEELAARYASLPAKSGEIQIEERRDGFVVNGRPFIDPEGRIGNYAFDAVSGDVGYVVEGPDGDVIKIARAGTTAAPLRIASASETPTGWQIVTTTGKTIAGDRYTVTPNGILVSRSTAAFLYTPGKDLTSIAVPEGYFLAEFQRGDASSTGYVLIEKDRSAAAGPSLKELGSLFGARVEDYALMNTTSGQLYPLNIQTGGKAVSVGTNCYRKNALVNKCNGSKRFESLYQPNGFKNLGHYYWKVIWVNTPAGPLAVSMDGTSTIILTDLNTGKQVIAFKRALGIGGFTLEQNGDGTVNIIARMGLSNEELKDVASFLQHGPAISVAAKK